jgi:hypothetical protein
MSSLDPTTGLVVLTLLGTVLAVAERAGGRRRTTGARLGNLARVRASGTGTVGRLGPSHDGDSGPTSGLTRPTLHCRDGEEERPGFVGGDGDPMLTDKERVEQALAEAGGRLRQQELLARSGWTKARMSRLLSSMAEDGTVVKIQVGRENVVCLEDALPTILSEDDDGGDPTATDDGDS